MNYSNFIKSRINSIIKSPTISSKFLDLKIKNKNFDEKLVKIALVGNPNTGKTTLFNRLTGSSQYVGNWPGVTVERKEGRIKNSKIPMKVIDLPGVYSLSPYSPEEIVTRNFLLDSSYDIILNVIDATNLERNLYLTTQLMELDAPILIALNMSDLLKIKGKIIDFCELEKRLGVPVVMISASKNIGIDILKEKVLTSYNFNKKLTKTNNFYNDSIEQKFKKIEKILNNLNIIKTNRRFIIAKILEDDILVNLYLKMNFEAIKNINAIKKESYFPNDEIVKLRYNFSYFISNKVIQDINKIKKTKLSRKIDKIVTGKYTAFPIFFIIIAFIFYMTFGPIGSFFEFQLNIIKDSFINLSSNILNQFGAPLQIKDLLGATLSGIFEIIMFVPQMIILFGMLAFLEDIGYMARTAFIMDRLLRNLGISGRAFVPILMGFGCNVPAILGTRILENKKEKYLSIFLIPFLSCSAKMPVYLLFLGAFLPNCKVFFIFIIYIIGIILGISIIFLLKNTILKDSDSPLIMELPDYKIPSSRNIFNHIWEKLRDFLERAGTVILGSTIIIWFLKSFDFNLRYIEDPSKSLLAIFGNILSPIFSLCGFGSWRSCVALITGTLSKESIVSTMAVVYEANPNMPLKTILKNDFNLASMFSFLTFVLLYVPCIATVSAQRKEFGNKWLTIFTVGFQSFFAWLLSMIVYQIGSILFL